MVLVGRIGGTLRDHSSRAQHTTKHGSTMKIGKVRRKSPHPLRPPAPSAYLEQYRDSGGFSF
jgi:hypothetical protein